MNDEYFVSAAREALAELIPDEDITKLDNGEVLQILRKCVVIAKDGDKVNLYFERAARDLTPVLARAFAEDVSRDIVWLKLDPAKTGIRIR